jgi:hypothetical protein
VNTKVVQYSSSSFLPFFGVAWRGRAKGRAILNRTRTLISRSFRVRVDFFPEPHAGDKRGQTNKNLPFRAGLVMTAVGLYELKYLFRFDTKQRGGFTQRNKIGLLPALSAK